MCDGKGNAGAEQARSSTSTFKDEISEENRPMNSRLLFFTWNLDGLDIEDLKKRTIDVIGKLKKQKPDVVFFQEVIRPVAGYLERVLPEYKGIRGETQLSYFTMTLFRTSTVNYEAHEIVAFPESKMGRNLLVCQASVGKQKFAFLNTHLESMRDFTEERQNQLRIAFSAAQSFSEEVAVIFGGDLNLRDKEERIPQGFNDVWKLCGSKKEWEYTWDLVRNTNKEGFNGFKPRMRFDRVYFKADKDRMVKAKYFALTGTQRVPETDKFPSDHWGIIISFEVRN